MRLRNLVVPAAAVAVLVAVSSASGAPSAQPLPTLAKRCATEGLEGETFRFRATDGVLLNGAVLGEGSVGVVLAHEYLGDLCRWATYAPKLAAEGYRVLVFDFRGYGLSAKAKGARDIRFDADVHGAVRELKRRGAKKVVVVGSSMGGAVAVLAAASAKGSIAGFVSVSPPDTRFLRGGGYGLARRDPTATAARVRIPALFLAAKGDIAVPVSHTRTLYSAAKSKDKRLVVLKGSMHGVSILDDSFDTGEKARALVLEFLEARSAG